MSLTLFLLVPALVVAQAPSEEPAPVPLDVPEVNRPARELTPPPLINLPPGDDAAEPAPAAPPSATPEPALTSDQSRPSRSVRLVGATLVGIFGGWGTALLATVGTFAAICAGGSCGGLSSLSVAAGALLGGTVLSVFTVSLATWLTHSALGGRASYGLALGVTALGVLAGVLLVGFTGIFGLIATLALPLLVAVVLENRPATPERQDPGAMALDGRGLGFTIRF